VAALGRELTWPGTEIKALGDSAALRSALPDDWSMYDPCDLMTATFKHGGAAVHEPYVARIVEDGATLVGLVFDDNGDTVSSARLAPSGRYGVIDKVWTKPAHQRRGLGTILMTKLGNRALDSGLTTGLLSATADGRALYSALGWTVVENLAGAFRA
jgi:predicted GNAT family acetyltransferase